MPREIEENDEFEYDEEERNLVGDFCGSIVANDDEAKISKTILCPVCSSVNSASAQGSCMRCGSEIPGAPDLTVEEASTSKPKTFVSFRTAMTGRGNLCIFAMRNDGKLFSLYPFVCNKWKALPECPQ